MNEWSIPLAALIVSLAALLSKLMGQRNNGSAALQAITTVLQAVAARLEHLPTVGEVTKQFTDNRHDVRQIVTALMINVENDIKEARVDVGVTAAKIEDEIRNGNGKVESELRELNKGVSNLLNRRDA